MKRRSIAELLAAIDTVTAEADRLATQLAFDRLDAAMAAGVRPSSLERIWNEIPVRWNGGMGEVGRPVYYGLGCTLTGCFCDWCVSEQSWAIEPAWPQAGSAGKILVRFVAGESEPEHHFSTSALNF